MTSHSDPFMPSFYVDDGWNRKYLFPFLYHYEYGGDKVKPMPPLEPETYARMMRNAGKKVGERMATGLVSWSQRVVVEHREREAQTSVFIEEFNPSTGEVRMRFQIDPDIIESLFFNSNPKQWDGDTDGDSWSGNGYSPPTVDLTLKCDFVTTTKK